MGSTLLPKLTFNDHYLSFQTVQYEADQEGYRPKISYEDTGLGQGGYDRNSQNQGGYQNQGGPY